jgi:predicted Zn-dependent peptidase
MDIQQTLVHLGEQIAKVENTWQLSKAEDGSSHLFIPSSYDQFFFSVTFSAGSLWEQPDTAGISHLLEHMMFRGSDRYPAFLDLAAEFEKFGGEWNAETGQSYTSYWYYGTTLGQEQIIELFREFIHHPRLQNLEQEKKIVLREIEEEINEFGEFTDLDIHLASIFWPHSAAALPITGTIESVRSISLEHLQQFRRQHYLPEKAFLTISRPGDSLPLQSMKTFFSESSAKIGGHSSGKLISKSGASKPALDPAPINAVNFKGPRLKIVENTDGQCSVQLGYLIPNARETGKLERMQLISSMMSHGFTSWLSLHLREKMGLVYDVGTHVQEVGTDAYLGITANVSYELLPEFFAELLHILADRSKTGIDPQELAVAKLKLCSDLMHAVHAPVGAVELAYELYHRPPIKKISGIANSVQNTNESSTLALLQELFAPERLGIVILGQASKIKIPALRKSLPSLSISYSISSS